MTFRSRRAYRIAVYGAIGLWTLVVFPSSLIVTILTGSHRVGHRWHARFWGRRILATCGVRWRVHGAENVSAERPCVLLVNHGSLFSAFAVAAALPLQWRAVLDRWLRWIPVFGWIGVLAGHVFLDRSRSPRAIESLNRAAARIQGGLSVLVFPEGRYDDEGRLLPFRKGAFHLAVRAGVPIVVCTAVETVEGPARVVRTVDLHVAEPICTGECTEADVPGLVERAYREMERHAVDGRLQVPA